MQPGGIMFVRVGALVLMLALASGCATTINLSKYNELEVDKKDCEILPPDYIVN